MDWLTKLRDKLSNDFPALPKSISFLVAAIISLSIAIYVATLLGQMTYDLVSERMPATYESLESARIKAAINKIEETHQPVSVNREHEINLLKARAEADVFRKQNGLPSENMEGSESLISILESIAKNTPSILVLMLAAYLLPAFSSTGEPWRLALNISAAVVLSGTYSLVKGITSNTAVHLGWREFFLTVNSGSVGVILILFGSLLSGICFYIKSHYCPVKGR